MRRAAQLEAMRGKSNRTGVVIGVYDENDMPLELTTKYRNRKAPHWQDRHGKPVQIDG